MTNSSLATLDLIHTSLDYASGVRVGGHTFVIIFGWLRMVNETRFALVDMNGANPTILKTIFWPRHDVEEIYGPCDPQIQRGYGFAAVAEWSIEVEGCLQLVGIQISDMKIIQRFQPKYYYSPDMFRDFVFELPIPVSEFKNFFDILLFDLFNIIDKKLYNECREEIKFGNTHQRPETSIVNVANEDADIFSCQILTLTELAKQQPCAELLVILPNVSQLDRTISLLTQIYKLTGVPMRLTTLGHKLNPRKVVTEASCAAKGKYIFYFDEHTAPALTFEVDPILRKLKYESEIALIVWQARDAITGAQTKTNVKYFSWQILENDYLQNIIKVFIPYNGGFAIRRQDLAECTANFLPYVGKNWMFAHIQHQFNLMQKKLWQADYFHEIYNHIAVSVPTDMREMRIRWFDELLFLRFCEVGTVFK